MGGLFFILILGSALHFVFQLTNFWKPVALIAPVNESTWEHLKMVFWPGLFFFLIEYQFLKKQTRNYWTAKAACLVLMPAVIAFGWYGAVALSGKNYFSINILLFVVAILAGQVVSYRLLTGPVLPAVYTRYAVVAIVGLSVAFPTLTFFPPRIFLFEHMDLQNTGQYGLLDNYEDLLIFTH